MGEVQAARVVRPRWLWVVVMLAVMSTLVLLALVALVGRANDPILVGTAFARAVCEGEYGVVADLVAPSLSAGMDADSLGAAMQARSECSGGVRDWAGQADVLHPTALVRVRLAMAGGQESFTELRVEEVDGHWRVVDFGPYRGPWPPQSD